ncbi:hypothetical protein DSO57_1021544 [Entomophthora muscae]|uniref:Uncharacterized protein n=1 Tax=Entomophthora muscae TaxID=34485 RepID=A0ACC2SG39_9FUNG|nr:hypothetical protein DSO57_1021544 [Entomophthora muscae]
MLANKHPSQSPSTQFLGKIASLTENNDTRDLVAQKAALLPRDHSSCYEGDSYYFPLTNTPPAQDFSKLGFVYITVLGLTNQVVPHTGSWCLLAIAVNYLVRIAPIVYMAFRAWPASPVGAQTGSGMGCETLSEGAVRYTCILKVTSIKEFISNQVLYCKNSQAYCQGPK